MRTTVLYGFGYIGRMIAKEIINTGILEIAGVIDVNEEIVGKDIGEVLGIKPLGIKVSSDPEDVFEKAKPYVVIHATGSYLNEVYDQIMLAIKYGAHVVSTCETLAYPWLKYPDLAEKLDREALERNVIVIGSGINPGFVFDSLPAFLTSVCTKVKEISVSRFIDASKRRFSFQKKIGLGLTPEEFAKKLSKGEITGHVGYAESLMLLSEIVGLGIVNVVEKQQPLISNTYLETEFFKIKPGEVKGIEGYGEGYDRSGLLKAKVKFIASVGQEDKDIIEIVCDNHVIKWISNGIPGDHATVAMILNIVKNLVNLRPGLRTMKDLILIHA